MKYKDQIHPALRGIAHRVPYNRVIIWFANIFQEISFRLTAVPKEVVHKTMAVEGYKRRKCRVDIFEPSGTA